MLICPRTCSKMLSISQPKLLRNSILRRTSPLSSRRNSIRNTTQPGIVLWVETSVHTLPTRPSTSSTSISAKSPSSSSNPVEECGWPRQDLDDMCRPLWTTKRHHLYRLTSRIGQLTPLEQTGMFLKKLSYILVCDKTNATEKVIVPAAFNVTVTLRSTSSRRRYLWKPFVLHL